jgi:RHS repeat-associated protein
LYSGEQFDSKIGQQYLRARYYDPATGRFNRLDPFFGDINDPQSLHKYLYTHADPINGIDPTGWFLFGDSLFGYMVEKQIEIQHRADKNFVGDTVLYGKWLKLGEKPVPCEEFEVPPLYRAKPDIANMTKKTYNEIKPLSPSGIVAGIAQMALRVTQFSGYGFVPDFTWFPPEQPLMVGTQLISVINIGGVLFYTDVEINITEALVYTTVDVAWTIYETSGAKYAVMNAISRALAMADTSRKIDEARLETQCPVGAMLTTAATVMVSFTCSFGF